MMEEPLFAITATKPSMLLLLSEPPIVPDLLPGRFSLAVAPAT
jgi:hypothetical protein